MRFKLGLLQDTATQEKQARREAAEAQAAKHKHETPTVKTEAQTLIDEDKAAKEKEKDEKGEKKQKEAAKPKVKIRPLTEAKAIDSGANFVSETFLLLVGVALILGENWRQNRKQKTHRDDMAERIEEIEKNARKGMVELEKEVLRLRGSQNQNKGTRQPRILSPDIYGSDDLEQDEREVSEKQGLWEWVRQKTIGNSNREENVEISESSPATEKANTTPNFIDSISSSQEKPSSNRTGKNGEFSRPSPLLPQDRKGSFTTGITRPPEDR